MGRTAARWGIPDRPTSLVRMEQPDLDAAERDVDDVEKALGRLDDGTYDRCEICGAPIADAVLEATPTARRCAEHAT
jgi:RNA polymerase-binding transcription factor DksA